MVTLLRSLEGQVHRVLALPKKGLFREVVVAEKLADEIIDLPRRPGWVADRFLRIGAGLKLARWAFRNRRHLTAIHANALTGLNLSVPSALLTRRRIVVWIHDPVGSKWGSRLGPTIRRLLPGLRIAAVSQTAEQVAVDNGLCKPGDATLVPNPIDPLEVVATTPKEPSETLVIGLLGGASERKGFDLLPDTVAALRDEPVKWLLYVHANVEPGMGPIWENLRSYPTDLVEPVAKVSDVRQAYASLDIVFCPSRNESFCRVAAEAMLNGLPVVGSDIEPLRRLLGDDEAGILFPVGDVDAASTALKRLVNSRDLRTQLGAVGKIRASAYQPDAIASQLMHLYGLAD